MMRLLASRAPVPRALCKLDVHWLCALLHLTTIELEPSYFACVLLLHNLDLEP
jgi:hypothetical protein